MKYPMLRQSDCERLADQMRLGHKPAVEPHIRYQGVGEDLNVEAVRTASHFINDLLASHRTAYAQDRDRLEGKAAPILYDALEGVDVAVLDDPGFWGYLSLGHFWSLIAWRQEEAFANGNHVKYVDGRSSTESVLPRMYIRVHSLGGKAYGHLAWALPKATDFWRSHILRVRTGTAPAVTRALVRKHLEHRLPTEELRPFARRLNRTWTNIALNTYDDREAQQLIDELWPSV